MNDSPSAAPWVNPVKARLARGEYVVGVPVTSTSLDLAARRHMPAHARHMPVWIALATIAASFGVMC